MGCLENPEGASRGCLETTGRASVLAPPNYRRKRGLPCPGQPRICCIDPMAISLWIVIYMKNMQLSTYDLNFSLKHSFFKLLLYITMFWNSSWWLSNKCFILPSYLACNFDTYEHTRDEKISADTLDLRNEMFESKPRWKSKIKDILQPKTRHKFWQRLFDWITIYVFYEILLITWIPKR